MTRPLIALGATLALLATAAQADTLAGDSYVTGRLCVGGDCVPGEGFGVTALKLKQTVNRMAFVDTSTGADFPTNDWQLWVNDDFQFGLDRFSILDSTGGTMPFTIEAGAPDNALWITDDGKIGLGTMMPLGSLQVSRPSLPSIMLQQTNNGPGFTPALWVQTIQPDGTHITYATTNSAALRLGTGVNADQTLGLRGNGNTYLSDHPDFNADARLHLSFDDGTTQLKIEEASNATSPRTLLNLQNNGRPDIVMGNTATGGEWSFGAGTNFVLKQGAVGTASSAKTKLFQIAPSGDATLYGTLVTQGPTCASGCDAVFDPGYDLPSIAEHAERMFALGHLPNVGPTKPGQPFNLTDKFGRLLNEVEHAHIYIAELHAQLAIQQAEHRREIAALSARLAQLETH